MATNVCCRARWVCGMALGIASLLGATAHAQPAAPQGAPIPKSPEFTSPDIKHTLWDWATARPVALGRKMAVTDPLQRPPFAGAPTDSLKGMAAGIRAVQLDAPNRAKAAAYLGTVDCVTYPQAQEMLIATMKEDPSEEVRYEAVMALRHMLTRGCSNMESECNCQKCSMCKYAARDTERHSDKMSDKLIKDAHGKAKKAAKEARKDLEKYERYDCCRGCCNAKALNALSEVAYGKDDQCCWLEPSERVRNAATVGLCLCKSVSVPVYYGEPVPTELIPVPETGGGLKEVDPNKQLEIDPNRKPEPPREQIPGKLPPAPTPEIEQPAAFLPLPSQVQATPIPSRGPAPVPAPAAESPVAAAPAPIAPAPVTAAEPAPAAALQPVSAPIAPIGTPVSAVSPAPQPATLVALKGYCIVAMKSRQFVPSKPEFSSVYEDRLYQFATAENKAAFDRDPEAFAPVYAGIDPVEWLKTHTMVEGKFLREFEGRFYLFVSKENWETFKATPQRFVLNGQKSAQDVVTR